MLLSFWSPGLYPLMLLRTLTGVGLGAVLVGANVLTHEHASLHRRGLAIALQSLAFALGVSLGGGLAHVFNEGLGWRYVFLTGDCSRSPPPSPAYCGCTNPRVPGAAPGGAPPPPSSACLPAFQAGMPYRQLFVAGQWRQTLALALAFSSSCSAFTS